MAYCVLKSFRYLDCDSLDLDSTAVAKILYIMTYCNFIIAFRDNSYRYVFLRISVHFIFHAFNRNELYDYLSYIKTSIGH